MAVMDAAFARDPWYHALMTTPDDPDGESRRRRDFLGFLFDLSLWTGSLLRGVSVDGVLAGAYILDRPGIGDADTAQSWLRVVWRALTVPIGLPWRRAAWIIAYLSQTRAAMPRRRSYYLALLGVHPDRQGRGVGRRLLEDILERVDADPRAEGIGLDTENGDNVGLYERFGFGLASTALIGPVNVYCLYRPRQQPADHTRPAMAL